MTDTDTLEGALLDAAVARAEGFRYIVSCDTVEVNDLPMELDEMGQDGCYCGVYAPSHDWKQAGHIIERERISISFDESEAGASWIAYCIGGHEGAGPTPLVAAMRAYVASKEQR